MSFLSPDPPAPPPPDPLLQAQQQAAQAAALQQQQQSLGIDNMNIIKMFGQNNALQAANTPSSIGANGQK